MIWGQVSKHSTSYQHYKVADVLRGPGDFAADRSG